MMDIKNTNTEELNDNYIGFLMNESIAEDKKLQKMMHEFDESQGKNCSNE